MDIQRKGVGRRKLIRRIVVATVVVIAFAAITWGLSRLQPAAPTVERATVWVDTVKRGEMLRQVRGLGTLVPEEFLWIPCTTEGRVERIYIRPGTIVKKDSLLMELSNPQLENDALDVLYQLKAAQAGSIDLKVKLQSAKLQQQASTAQLQSDYTLGKIQAEKDESLAKLGLTAEINARISRAKADELANRYAIEQKRLDINDESVQAQLAAQQVQVDKLQALLKLRMNQVEALKVRAGTEGVLQQVPVEEGQKLAAGTILAKVTQPWKLKAELKIPETQAKDIVIGLEASVDTHNGVIPGHVFRIDPAAVNGTVTVDVKLQGALPSGSRPDLSVDGTIELERLPDVLYVGRPVFGQANSLITLFKLDEQGKMANRVQVRLGRLSVNTVEIVEGLRIGDQVVLSDMSQHDSQSRIRLN
jgi:HlyD family secretion protein